MAFTDYLGQYLQNRMDQATQPFTDPSAYMQNRLENAFPGTETEEERRKRLAREAAERGNTEVQSQTVKTYADGSQEEVTKKQIPAQTQAPAQQPQPNQYMNLANSAGPTVAYQPPPAPVAPQPPVQQQPVQQAPQPVAPVAPQAPVQQAPAPQPTFNRMIQAESGGQQFAPNGQILTSPKGALGLAQVMPATAANPGFGVAPATPEEIATPEGNRAFGQRYYEGLLKHFGGDEQKAIAAYNAGPGRVQQNMAANQGQLNVAQLPQETQDYLKRVQGPAVPGQPGTQPLIAGTPSSDVGLTPTEQAIKQQGNWINRLVELQSDPAGMYALTKDANAPEWVKQQARDFVKGDLSQVNGETKANRLIEEAGKTGNFSPVFREAQSKTEEGSWIKYYLFNRLGLGEAASQEAEKLGFGNKTIVANGPNGEHGMITYSKSGKPVSGVDSNGTPIPQDQLIQWASLGSGKSPLVDRMLQASTNVMNQMRQYNEKNGQFYSETEIQAAGKKAADAVKLMYSQSTQPGQVRPAGAQNVPGGPSAPPVPGAPGTTPQAQPNTKEYYEENRQLRRPEGIPGLVADTPTSFAERQKVNIDEVRAQAEKIARYEQRPAPQGRSTPFNREVMLEVKKLNPDYDEKKFAAASRAITNFTTGKQGDTVRSLDVAVDHIDTVRGLIDEMKNGKYSTFNAIANRYSELTGEPAFTNFEAAKEILGDEVAKAVVGSGGGALADREAIKKTFNAAKSPEQLNGVLDTYQKLMTGQLSGLKRQWTSAGLPADQFDEKLSDRARSVLSNPHSKSGEAGPKIIKREKIE